MICFRSSIFSLTKPEKAKPYEKRRKEKLAEVEHRSLALSNVLAGFFGIAFAEAKFPWPMNLPLLLIGPMLVSNKMLSTAIGE